MPKILVIDDESAYREVVQGLLRAKGFETTTASGLAAGIASARGESPDLIVSDVNLGDGDGFELLKTLRSDLRTSSIPVVLMTGDIDDARTRHGMGLGADDFLEKPFKPEWLLATVHAQLEKREEARRQSEEIQKRLVAILEATPDLVCVLTAQSHSITYLNQAGRQMLGCGKNEDLSGCGLSDVLSPEAFERVRLEALALAARDGKWRGETVFRTRSGQNVSVAGLIQSHNGPEGVVEFFSAVMHDLTESKRAEQERHRVEIQLRQAQKLDSIGRLAAGIAHEINTPTQYIGDNTRFLQDAFRDLAVYLGNCDRLIIAAKNGPIDAEILESVLSAASSADLEYLREEIPKAIQQSLEGVERVTRIVRAMKEFSHPDSAEKASLDLNRAIESTLMVCRNEWKYVAEVITDFDQQLAPVPCLAGEFNQVILNLVINATHAIADVVGDGSQGKGKIRITTRRAQDCAEIRVRDSGSGIPEAIRNRIFEPFFTTKGVGKGTGQGLAIARSVIVDKHGGSLDFETEPGSGTTFIIRLPLTAPASRGGVTGLGAGSTRKTVVSAERS